MSDAAKPLSEIGVLIKRLWDKMEDPSLKNTLADWGESAEEAMKQLALLNHGFDYYDCLMSDRIGIAQVVGRVEEEKNLWVAVTQLTVSHEYYNDQQDLVGQAERHCYFGFNIQTNMINAFFTEEQIENYKPSEGYANAAA